MIQFLLLHIEHARLNERGEKDVVCMQFVSKREGVELIGVYFNWKIDYRIFGRAELGK